MDRDLGNVSWLKDQLFVLQVFLEFPCAIKYELNIENEVNYMTYPEHFNQNKQIV